MISNNYDDTTRGRRGENDRSRVEREEVWFLAKRV